jgi:hypothetical protein
MAFFNFIETFFFISLGITFVLILLLINHFRQRMSTLEHKCDTMFEIINDVVKQMNSLRIQSDTPSNIPYMNLFNPLSQSKMMPQFDTFLNEKIEVSDDSDNVEVIDEDDDENDEDDEDEDDDEDNDEDNDDEDHEDDEDEDDEDEDDEDEDDDDDDEDDDDGEDDDQDDDNNDSIKIINVTINDSNVIEPISIEELAENIENDIESDDIQEIDNSIIEETNIESIHVEKIIPSNDSQLDAIYEKESEKEVEKEIYKKMSLSALKTLVISKGLCSDASKLKKQDLLKLLETSQE